MSERIKLIEEILKASGADEYEITETKEKGWEFYFIRHRLDQNRAKELVEYKVKAFKKYANPDNPEELFLGSAAGDIPATASKEEIEKMVANLVYQAGMVRNPYYEIVGPEERGSQDATDAQAVSSAQDASDAKAVSPAQTASPAQAGGAPQSNGEINLAQISKDFIQAFDSVKETETEDINSYEIFVSEKERHFKNSKGVELSFAYPSSMIEVVTNARNYPLGADTSALSDAMEIELYRLYNRGTCDKAALIYDVEELLHMGKDKLRAVDTPAIRKAPLILSTGDSVGIYYYFLTQMAAARKYMGATNWEIGEPIAREIKGDTITLKALPVLENSSKNFLYDEEGSPVRERYIIKDNIPENHWGSRQFSQYLGLKDSSNVYNYWVFGGTKSGEELRTGPYLEVVEFSGFDCDTMTGDIAGEIRLGYWHDGEKLTPVSGGSISGNMTEFIKEMYLSKELRQYNNALIPAVTRLENATVTGVE